ncbi:rds1 [Blastomyces dermatitidis ER-3]|uniref:Rds1 n=1 Tax=Ajellomyces dermatitidis (strain ER-3 / ATCC MYA-2586) TaxID=559297 RepID=A0ABP2F4Z2_AJEDR|nr:rds1 [Blastomyces dermatitidis ER-3]EEQ91212.1 rds1 [Blastomyces dermatitidis ER-3]EQL32024.1 hypothetical protein BDFG_05745 [Blastomyces dermatitidis ATCC 26199]
MSLKQTVIGLLASAYAIIVVSAQRSITYADGIVVPASVPTVTGIDVSRGSFTGTPTVTGALSGTAILGTAISPKPAPANATTYPSDGRLHDPQPAPYVPGGGLGTNGTMPVYNAKSDYDFQSLALALYFKWIELDLLDYGLSHFSQKELTNANLSSEDRYLISFMSEQVVGHATMLTNILGRAAPKQCNYNYPNFTDVREWLDFSQKLIRNNEAGVYGFLPHLTSREAAALVLRSVTVTARQQVIFRQFEGLFPMPVWFEVGIPQSWAWSLLAPYIASCPTTNQSRLVWQNFPALRVLSQPNPFRTNGSAAVNETLGPWLNSANFTEIPPRQRCNVSECGPAITQNRSIPLSRPGRPVRLQWEAPGKPVGPGNGYVTHSSAAGPPAFVAWVTQLNVTYSPLTDVVMMGGGVGNATNSTTGGGGGGGRGGRGSGRRAHGRIEFLDPRQVSDNGTTGGGGGGGGAAGSGLTIQPDLSTYEGDPAINGTIFIALTDSNPFLTPFNLSLINPHVVAGPAVYQAG